MLRFECQGWEFYEQMVSIMPSVHARGSRAFSPSTSSVPQFIEDPGAQSQIYDSVIDPILKEISMEAANAGSISGTKVSTVGSTVSNIDVIGHYHDDPEFIDIAEDSDSMELDYGDNQDVDVVMGSIPAQDQGSTLTTSVALKPKSTTSSTKRKSSIIDDTLINKLEKNKLVDSSDPSSSGPPSKRSKNRSSRKAGGKQAAAKLEEVSQTAALVGMQGTINRFTDMIEKFSNETGKSAPLQPALSTPFTLSEQQPDTLKIAINAIEHEDDLTEEEQAKMIMIFMKSNDIAKAYVNIEKAGVKKYFIRQQLDAF